MIFRLGEGKLALPYTRIVPVRTAFLLHEYALLGHEKASIKFSPRVGQQNILAVYRKWRVVQFRNGAWKTAHSTWTLIWRKRREIMCAFWVRSLAFSVLPSFAWALKHEQSKIMCVIELCSPTLMPGSLLMMLETWYYSLCMQSNYACF